MNDYEVRFVYELVNVVTYVTADTKKQARRWARTQVFDSTGLDSDEATEVTITKVGGFA